MIIGFIAALKPFFDAFTAIFGIAVIKLEREQEPTYLSLLDYYMPTIILLLQIVFGGPFLYYYLYEPSVCAKNLKRELERKQMQYKVNHTDQRNRESLLEPIMFWMTQDWCQHFNQLNYDLFYLFLWL